MDEFIHIEPMPLPLKDLQLLIKYSNTLKFGKAKLANNNQSNNINLNTRNVGSYHIGENSFLMSDVFWANYLEFVCRKTLVKYYNKLNNIFSINNFETFEILKYNESHKFNFHIDHGPLVPRTLSFVFLLNNDYEGGDLIFHNKDKKFMIPKNPNQLVIFPSNFLFPHEVTPITKGTRYSVVSWAL
jgi:predicted 2-oxoglutarate/Fe(II)-dependent dioxygenase YbiX